MRIEIHYSDLSDNLFKRVGDFYFYVGKQSDMKLTGQEKTTYFKMNDAFTVMFVQCSFIHS